MSHLPPGVTFNEIGKATLTIQVVNKGRTPAYVTDVRLSPTVLPNTESLPVRPRYNAPRPAQATRSVNKQIGCSQDAEFAASSKQLIASNITKLPTLLNKG